MRRWAIINKRNDEEIVNLGWSSNSYTQKDAENYALRCKFGIRGNERVAVVETNLRVIFEYIHKNIPIDLHNIEVLSNLLLKEVTIRTNL